MMFRSLSVIALFVVVGGGRSAAQEPAPPPSAQATFESEDERIVGRLRAIFEQVESLAGIEVSVRAGVVTLSGETLSAASGARAEEIASSIDGVVLVQNDLTETVDLEERLLPGLDKIWSYARSWTLQIPLFLIALAIVGVFWLLARLVTRGRFPVDRLAKNRLIQNVVRQIIRTSIVVLGVFLALEILDATALVGAVLGTAGVVGLAVGLAFRDIVENYLASLSLSIWRPFQAKDLVEIGEHTGAVIRMTTRETVLMTLDGNHVSLPNATVFKSTILNYTRNPLRRFTVALGVGSDSDLQRAQELGLGVLRSMKGVVDDPAPIATVARLGDSSVEIRFHGWVDQRSADFLKVQSEATRLLKEVMDENGVELPVPTFRIERAGRGTAPARMPFRPRERDLQEEAARLDVSVQHDIGRQIDEERRAGTDSDLLTS